MVLYLNGITLFGRVMNINVSKCGSFQWLTQLGGNTGKIYISILSHAVISFGNYTVNKMQASGSCY